MSGVQIPLPRPLRGGPFRAHVLRTRYIRAFDIPKRPGVLVVVEAIKGQLVSWTMIPTKASYLNRQRYGELLYGR